MVWLSPATGGLSQQYLTRTAVTPFGTVNGTMTYDPWREAGNEPVMTRAASSGAPGQRAGAAATGTAGTRAPSATRVASSVLRTFATLPGRALASRAVTDALFVPDG